MQTMPISNCIQRYDAGRDESPESVAVPTSACMKILLACSKAGALFDESPSPNCIPSVEDAALALGQLERIRSRMPGPVNGALVVDRCARHIALARTCSRSRSGCYAGGNIRDS